MNNDIYDVLEACLQSIEHGANMDTLLARYPQFADELRPLLKAALSARAMPISSPSASGMRRGRSQLLQKAAEMREAKAAPRSRRSVIPMFQRLAITLGLTSALVFSGTGLVGASSAALPGENLYPVKRTWENVRLIFIFNADSRDALESTYEQERLHEATALLAEGRHETIQFSGVYTQVNGKDYISGIPALFNSGTQRPADLINGDAVTVNGFTNSDGYILIDTISLLPPGSSVPLGQPVEAESQSENGNSSGAGSQTGSGSSSDQDMTPKPESHAAQDKFKIEGTIDSLQGTEVKVNGQTVYVVDTAQINGSLKPGANVEVEGYYALDGKFIVTKITVKNSGSSDGGDNNNSGSGSNSGNENSSGGGDTGGSGGGSGGGGGDGGGGSGGGGGGGGDDNGNGT